MQQRSRRFLRENFFGLSLTLIGLLCLALAGILYLGRGRFAQFAWADGQGLEGPEIDVLERQNRAFERIAQAVTPAVANIRTTQIIKVQQSPFFMDPFFRQFFGDMFGPEMGMAKSACPDAPLTLMLPMTRTPGLIGEPRACTTAGLVCAAARASLYTSDDFTMPKTIVIMSIIKAAKTTRNPTQATGTNHFQFLCHQVRDFSLADAGCFFSSTAISSPMKSILFLQLF